MLLCQQYIGTTTLSNGERIGYNLLHSVDTPLCPPPTSDSSVVRCSVSCYWLYYEREPGVMEIHMQGQFDPAGRVIDSIAISSAIDTMISCAIAIECSQNRKLSFLLKQQQQTADTKSGTLFIWA